MLKPDNSVAIIPRENFSWRPRVQFKESFPTRAEALDFAFEHGFNLIVENHEGRKYHYDVLLDPDRVCISGLSMVSMEMEDVLVEPDSRGWSDLVLASAYNFGKRVASAAATTYMQEIIPVCHSLAPFARAAMLRISPYIQRAAVMYRRDVSPQVRHATTKLWWSDTVLNFRRAWHRNSQGTAKDFAKRLPATAVTTYNRELVPACRKAAAFAALQLRHAVPASRRAAIQAADLYRQEIAPLIRHAAAVLSAQAEKMVPVSRRAAATAAIDDQEIASACRRTGTSTVVRFREIHEIRRRAAARSRWPESNGDSHHEVWAAVAAPHTHPSQLRLFR